MIKVTFKLPSVMIVRFSEKKKKRNSTDLIHLKFMFSICFVPDHVSVFCTHAYKLKSIHDASLPRKKTMVNQFIVVAGGGRGREEYTHGFHIFCFDIWSRMSKFEKI